MQRYLIVFLLFMCFLPGLFAIGDYKPGDTLYVWSYSGLILRNRPNLNAARIKNVPYGTFLVALNYNGSKNTEVDLISAFSKDNKQLPSVVIKGDFARVVFQGDTGYVYDGYLSRMPALKQSKINTNKQPVFEAFETYANRSFGLLKDQKSSPKAEYGKPFTRKRIYANGITVDEYSEKGGETRLILPDVSLEECLMLFKYLTGCTWDLPEKARKTEDSWTMNKVSDYEYHFSQGNGDYTVRYIPEMKVSFFTLYFEE
ncbi:MAG: SH3 domain-containing protein [Bacteroidetes bacterium]|nr:SH3 domain-containing protein [Bacteroidota bacterium]